MTIFQLSDTNIEKLRPIFGCLTTLQLHPYVTKRGDGPEKAKQHRCLEVLLQEATELRTLFSSGWFLSRECDEPDEPNEENKVLVLSERADFGMFLGKPWPHLTKLVLESACVKAADLMSIVRTQRESPRPFPNVHAIYATTLLQEGGARPCIRSRHDAVDASGFARDRRETHCMITGKLKTGSP